jgi:polysaccharide export outer membrane protein
MIQMASKFVHAWLAALLLTVSFAEALVAQVGTPQIPASSNGMTSSRSSANRSGLSSGLAAVPADFSKLKLSAGFMVSLNVLDDPDFTGSFRIDEQGDIALPILGTIHVGGETAQEARVQIAKRLLDEQILKAPQVILTVVEYTAPEVTLTGEVANPGKYPLLAPRKLVDVLASAGGTTLLAGNEVLITRGTGESEPILVHYSRTTNPKAIEDIVVQPGDTVQVKRAGVVYVLGAVNRPGGYVMQEQGTLNVLQAIGLASGTVPTAATGTIYLIRRNADGTVVYVDLPYKKMTNGRAGTVELHSSDMLYVPTSKMKSIFSNTQNIINAAATSAIYKY